MEDKVTRNLCVMRQQTRSKEKNKPIRLKSINILIKKRISRGRIWRRTKPNEKNILHVSTNTKPRAGSSLLNWIVAPSLFRSTSRNLIWLPTASLTYESGLYWLINWNFTFFVKGISAHLQRPTALMTSRTTSSIWQITQCRSTRFVMASSKTGTSCLSASCASTWPNNRYKQCGLV